MMLKPSALIEAFKNDADPFRVIPSPSFEDLVKQGSASIDLRLGRWFLLLRETRTLGLKIEEEPQTKYVFVPFKEKFILHPRKFVLGTTLEWVRLPASIAGYVTGKSSWGRKGLVIETAAGIQPGFSGCLTLELANMGEVPIELIPGIPICQIFLHKTTDGIAGNAGQFSGRRRPTHGKIPIDPIMRKLMS